MRGKTPEDRKLLELLDPIAEAVGYEIVRVRLMGGHKSGRTLQVMAERPADGDMGIDDCTRLSRAISEVFEVADPVEGEYRLEVSSPGVDRPLTRLKDFESFAGLEAKIELDRMADNRKRFKGVLAGVDGDQVLIDLEGEADTTAQVPFAWISDAKLTLSDELLKRGAAARAARLEAETPDQSDQPDAEEDA